MTESDRSIEDLVRDQDIIVCCGSGGVGKTTTAAVLAMRAAEPVGGQWSSPSTRRSGSPTRSAWRG